MFTDEVLEKARRLLNQGYTGADAADELGVKIDTFRKAINDGRIVEPAHVSVGSTKSSRNASDMAAADGMGVGCTRSSERILAARGGLVGDPVHFQPCLDVPKAGVLCALPALLANGLLEGLRWFWLLGGDGDSGSQAPGTSINGSDRFRTRRWGWRFFHYR